MNAMSKFPPFCPFCASSVSPFVETCAEGWYRAACARTNQCGARGSWEADKETAMRKFMEVGGVGFHDSKDPYHSFEMTFAGLGSIELRRVIQFALMHGWRREKPEHKDDSVA